MRFSAARRAQAKRYFRAGLDLQSEAAGRGVLGVVQDGLASRFLAPFGGGSDGTRGAARRGIGADLPSCAAGGGRAGCVVVWVGGCVVVARARARGNGLGRGRVAMRITTQAAAGLAEGAATATETNVSTVDDGPGTRKNSVQW